MNLIKTLTRYAIYTMLAVVLFSCQGEELKHKVIISKSNESFFNEPLKDGWCRFFYKTHEKGDWIEFKEKCEKYNIGDTINVNFKLAQRRVIITGNGFV